MSNRQELKDELKQDAKKTITRLRKYGIKRIVMLTGDQKDIGAYYGKVLGIKVVYSELLPADKVSKVEQLLHMKSSHGSLTFVGDGMNDAPVLSRADVGIAMGQIGSDAAIEAADVVLMTDEPSKILTAIKIAKKTLKLVHQNIIFALSIKFLVLLLGALGFTNMWEAVFADVGVSIIAILNAMRTLHISSTED